MFTGIVEAMGSVVRLAPGERGGRRLELAVPAEAGWRLPVGDSVAVSGVCLTVVAGAPGRLAFDLGEETLRATTLGGLAPGDPVNLERPLRLDARLGGHLVLGHVDGVGQVVGRRPAEGGAWLEVAVPEDLRALLVPKGSVAVDGVSLTVAALDGATVGLGLVAHTLAATTLGRRQPGERVNLEMDVIGKYIRGFVERWEQARRAP